MSESSRKHKETAPKKLNFAVVTCSSSRYRELEQGKSVEDPSGDFIVKALESNGHKVVFRKIIPDDLARIQEKVSSLLTSNEVDAVIVCGGTGISPFDVTIEAVQPLLNKVLPGFGELFRKLSYEEIGSAAILTRALAGVADGKAVFCIPGSPQAVRLCVEKFILPETGHILKHAREKSCN